MNDDYFDGRNGRGPGANVDWVDYQRGRNDAERARQNAVASSPPAKSPSPWGGGGGGGDGGGGGGGLGILVVAGAVLAAIGVGIALAVTLLLPALIAALLVFAAARLRPGRQAPTYGEAYGAALIGLMAYVLITAGVGFGLTLLLDGRRQPGLLFELARIATAALQVGLVSLESADVAGRVLEQLSAAAEDPRWRPGMLAGALAMLHGPGLLACALVLRWRLDATFGGWLGFLAACVVSLLAVLASIFSSAWAFVFLVRHAEVLRFATDAAVLNAAFVAGLVLLAHVAIGGALAALLLYAVLRPRFGAAAAAGAPPAPRYLACYGSGSFVMLAYGLLLTVGFWLFREGDALLAALRGGEGPAALAALPGPALRDFLLLQTPALALGVAMMAAQPGRREAGSARRAVIALAFAVGLPLAALLTLSIAAPRSADQFAVQRQPLLQALGLQPLMTGLRPGAAAASAFDGEWYSAQRRYGLRIAGVRGFVTVPGGGALQAGHTVLSIEAVAGRGFRGQHIAPDGRWQPVTGELLDAQTLRLRNATTAWTLSRR
ncbi:hypothetical protein [uncultured Methylibium sp.]|uniref:hypothetical protein n=1 Tax=uncultured Methylibium sp. TaxID=381093 RepID=UPI0025F74919|nr:hypothetical protein [uncultured Methylibium sp.]